SACQLAELNTEKLSAPCSQTDVGGLIGAATVSPPGAATRRTNAFGSHEPICCSPVPGTSGENRASAFAAWPLWSTICAAVAWPACAAETCVGRGEPFLSRSVTAGRPETAHGEVEVFVSRSS